MPDKIDIEEAKIKTNTFLWEILPDNTTLKEAEKIALDILELINDE